MDLVVFQNWLDNTSFAVLLATMLAYWVGAAFPGIPYLWPLGTAGFAVANLCTAALLGSRWIDAGYFPLSNLYESLFFLVWGITTIHLIAENMSRSRLVGVCTAPVAMSITAFAALSLPPQMQSAEPLVPALKSNWLMMHVSVMMLSYATLMVGSLLSIAFLIVTRGQNVELRGSSIGNGAYRQVKINRLGDSPVAPAITANTLFSNNSSNVQGNVALLERPPISPEIPFPRTSQPRRHPRQHRLSHHRFRISPPHHWYHRRRRVGKRSLGLLLELGPQRNLGTHHLARLRRLPPRPHHQRLARTPPRHFSCLRFFRHLDLLSWGQSFGQRAAFLRLVFLNTSFLSFVTCPLSLVPCHLSLVTCPLLLNDK